MDNFISPRILDINPSLPYGVQAVIKKVLEKEPKHRYGSGMEFANAFLAALPQPLTSEANLVRLPPSQPPREDDAPELPRPVVAPKAPSLPARLKAWLASVSERLFVR